MGLIDSVLDVPGDLLGGLFGSEPGGYYGEQAPMITPEQKRLLNDLIAQIKPGESVETYGGQRVADTSPFQEQSYDLLRDITDGSDAYAQGRDVLSGLLSPYDPSARRDYFRKTFRDPAIKSFEEEGIANILEPYISRGGMRSGASGRALADAGANLEAMLAGKESELLYKGEEAHADRRAGLLPESRAFAETPLKQLGLLSAFGGEQRGIESEQLRSEMQKWQEEQAWANPWLQYFSPAMGVKAFDPIVREPQPSLFESMLPAIGEIGAAAIPFLL